MNFRCTALSAGHVATAAAFLFLFFAMSLPGLAQSTAGRVLGSVSDPSGAAVTGADTQGHTHDSTLTVPAAGLHPQYGRFSANWTGDAKPLPPRRRWSDKLARGQEVHPGADGLEAAPRAA